MGCFFDLIPTGVRMAAHSNVKQSRLPDWLIGALRQLRLPCYLSAGLLSVKKVFAKTS